MTDDSERRKRQLAFELLRVFNESAVIIWFVIILVINKSDYRPYMVPFSGDFKHNMIMSAPHHLNPLSPKSDQHQISHCNMNAL